MVSKATEHPFLSPERVISTFGASRAEASMEYARYVNEDLEESHQIALEKRMTLQQILSLDSGGRPRDERIWRAYFVHHYRISDIATAAGLSDPTVSRILRRYPKRDYFVGS
jgi:AraC-like DNA-binding protein